MEMMRYECAATAMITEEGRPLAAGCICRKTVAEEVRKELEKLKEYKVRSKDPYGLDMELAERMGGLAHDTVICCGCSVHVSEAGYPEGVTSGGVIGDPAEKPESSDEDIIDLSENFYMYTEPGGPGLAANAFGDTVRQALLEMKAVPMQQMDGETFHKICRKYGISVALLVYDGTGKDRQAKLLKLDLNGAAEYTCQDNSTT